MASRVSAGPSYGSGWGCERACTGILLLHRPQAGGPHRAAAQAGGGVLGAGGTAIFLYDDLRKASSPKAALLEFLESAYQAGVKTAGWYFEGLRAVPVG